jgi:3-oxoadipate enol-lactonase
MPHTEHSIYYETADLRPPWATDSPAVLFHHGIGINLDIWSQWVPVVAPHYPVIRFDMRGFGRSKIPGNVSDWSLDDLVSDVWRVADAAGCKSVHLVGESLGATVVLAAALAHPERVLSLRMLNGTFKGQGLGELPNWKAQFAAGNSQGWSKRMMVNRFYESDASAQALAWFEAEQAKTDPDVAIALGSILAQTDLTSKLSALVAPATIVLPDQSPFVPVTHGEEFLRLVRHADFQVVKGVKHGLPFCKAQQQAQSLLKTLDRISDS